MRHLWTDLGSTLINSSLFPVLAEARFQYRWRRSLRQPDRARRVHAYCIGLGKTGTHSIAAMFADSLRSAHEPDRYYVVAVTARPGRQPATPARLRAWLRRRDRLHRLELESSSLITDWLPHLVEIFPAAKFIFPIRDPYTWLESVLNQWELKRGRS
jgi:hypothetical protein